MIHLSNGGMIRIDAIRYFIGGVVGIECGSESIRYKLDNDKDIEAVRSALVAV